MTDHSCSASFASRGAMAQESMSGRALPGPTYFTAPTGTVYRVLDSAWRNGKRIVAAPPAAWGMIRIFNPESGPWRFYSLALRPDESQEPTPELLAKQFTKSELGGHSVTVPLGQRGQEGARTQR